MAIKSDLLRQHLKSWKEKLLQDPVRAENDKDQRFERVVYYQARTADKIRAMTEEEIFEYIAKLWAMLIWGNKK